MLTVAGAAALVIRASNRRYLRSNRELAEIKRRLHLGLVLPGISMFSVGRDSKVAWFAGRAIPGTSLSMGTAVGAETHDLIGDWPDWLEAVRGALRGQTRTVQVEVADAILEIGCTPLRDDDAQISEALITVRDNTEGQREAERAERLAQMRSRALATINHKLRGQLNGMLGIADLLGTTELTERQRAWTGLVSTSGHRLLKFVHHLIEFMELDAERFELTREPFSLRTTLDSVILDHHDRAEASHTTLISRYPLDLSEHFAGNGEQVCQLIDLLVGVALGTNAGGEVVVNVEEHDRDVAETTMVVTVEDSGRGLRPEALERVFDGLESPSAMWSIRSGGTGLELPIARLLARAMGGDVTVESRPNIGTTLRLEVPMDRATLTEIVTPETPAALDPDRPLRILLVDDSELQSQVGVHLLRQLGHRVTVARNGAEAIELLDTTRNSIDVMLTELHMPVLDGFAATNAIRQRTDANRELPILATTSDTRRSTRSRALAAGFDEVIQKPLELTTLRDGLAALRRHQSESDDETANDIDDPVIEEATLNRVRELDPTGEQRLLEELIQAFLEAAPRQLLEVRDAALALDTAQLDPLIRSITTSCRLLGARRLERRAAWLLRAVKADDLAEARSAADALTAEFALARRALTAVNVNRAA